MVDSLAFYFADVVKKKNGIPFFACFDKQKVPNIYVKHFVLICTASGT